MFDTLLLRPRKAGVMVLVRNGIVAATEVCRRRIALLWITYPGSSGNIVLPFWEKHIGAIFKGKSPRRWARQVVGCSEMSVINYHYSLDNNPEERNSRGGSLKSRTKLFTLIQKQIRLLNKPELSVRFVILTPVALGCDDVNFGMDIGRGQLKCDGTRVKTRFRLSAKRTSPFKTAGGVSSVDYWQLRCAHQR